MLALRFICKTLPTHYNSCVQAGRSPLDLRQRMHFMNHFNKQRELRSHRVSLFGGR